MEKMDSKSIEKLLKDEQDKLLVEIKEKVERKKEKSLWWWVWAIGVFYFYLFTFSFRFAVLKRFNGHSRVSFTDDPVDARRTGAPVAAADCAPVEPVC